MSHVSHSGGPFWFRHLKRIEQGLITGEKAVCVLSMAVMLFATALTVLARNAALHMPNYGELGLAALVPLTLIGGALCTALGSHIAVDIINNLPFRAVVRGAEILVAIATLVFAWIYARSGIYLILEFYATNDKLLDLGTPLWILTLCFPIGMALMAFHALMRVVGLFVERPAAQAGEIGA